MHFAVITRDRPGTAELRQRLRQEHRTWLRQPGDHPIVVRLGGPLLDERSGQMNGTLLVVEAERIEQVRAFLDDDPYCRHGLFEHIDIRPWQWGLTQMAPEALEPPAIGAPTIPIGNIP